VIPKNAPEKIPAPRTSHSSCVYKDRYIFIIGGEGVKDPSITVE